MTNSQATKTTVRFLAGQEGTHPKNPPRPPQPPARQRWHTARVLYVCRKTGDVKRMIGRWRMTEDAALVRFCEMALATLAHAIEGTNVNGAMRADADTEGEFLTLTLRA